MVRQTNPSFDERAFGFANLADLLRAAHRDGSVRVERDRQGVIRIFQANGAGAVVPASAVPPAPAHFDVAGDELEPSDEMTAPDEEPLAVASAAATLGVPVAAEPDESADSADAGEAGDAAEAAPAAAPKRRRRTRGGGTARPRAKKTTRGS
jgi:hypothetical protein